MPPAAPDPIDAIAPAISRGFDESLRRRYRGHADRLIRRVSWEAAQGFTIDDTTIGTIAAHAAALVAGFEPATDPYRDVTSVIVHAGTFVSHEVVAGPTRGVVSAGPRALAGQAGPGRGPIVLDWRTARREIARPEGGTNVIYHEFAHKLDQLDGVFDGAPPLGDDTARAEWAQTFGTNLRRLQRRGSDPVIRSYAATDQIEFFAVTTELFFTVPARLRAAHPRVYARLADFYRQDPAATIATDEPRH